VIIIFAGLVKVAKERVVEYVIPFKHIPYSDYFKKLGVVGQPAYFYERYTDDQLESLRQLMLYYGEAHDIPLHYNEDMWDISVNALNGSHGIYTHVSYRTDKSDCHPQPELIEILKSLE